MKWRSTFGADELLKWDVPEVLLQYSPGGFYGQDKQGHPLWFEPAGLFDAKG